MKQRAAPESLKAINCFAGHVLSLHSCISILLGDWLLRYHQERTTIPEGKLRFFLAETYTQMPATL